MKISMVKIMFPEKLYTWISLGIKFVAKRPTYLTVYNYTKNCFFSYAMFAEYLEHNSNFYRHIHWTFFSKSKTSLRPPSAIYAFSKNHVVKTYTQ